MDGVAIYTGGTNKQTKKLQNKIDFSSRGKTQRRKGWKTA